MRKITLSDIPEEYYETQPLAFRGNISSTPVKKPTDLSKIPQQIWIKKPGSQGKMPQDFESVTVDLPIDLSKDVLNPDQGKIATPSQYGVNEKRKRLFRLEQPLFHYRNDEAINRLYDANFNKPLINSEQSIRDLMLKIENRAQGNGSVATDKIQNSPQKTGSTIAYSPSLNPAEKWVQLQTYLLENDQVILDLETGHKSSTELTTFENLMTQVQHYGLRLDRNQVIEKRRQISLNFVQDRINSLQGIANRCTIVSANFAIEERQEDYKLIFSHPLTQFSNRKIKIIVEVHKQDMESGWWRYYARLIKSTIRVNVFGIVFKSEQVPQGHWEVVIKPVVIYADTTIPQGV